MDILLNILTFAPPIILAITLHEAAHGYVALRYGDDTAQRAGRISLNPFRHIDALGTLLVPGFLIFMNSPILFGYAKPVPVNFSKLRNPRIDSIYVAAAGPAMNILLGFVSALLMHLVVFFSPAMAEIFKAMLTMSLWLNVTLAVFNMLPILPLDGGRVLLGFLPQKWAEPFSRIEPYGIFIVLALLLIPTFLGFNVLAWTVFHPIKIIVGLIAFLTGISPESLYTLH